MAGIFTRPKLQEILANENLSTDERMDRIMILRGRDLDDGYVSRSAAKADMDSAIEKAKEEWEKSIPKPDIKASEEYKALESEYAGYKAMQEARGSETYKGVKPKFFETVYGMVSKGGETPEADQMAKIREEWPEYFAEAAEAEAPKNTPQFSKPAGNPGVNPESEEDKIFKQLSEQWR